MIDRRPTLRRGGWLYRSSVSGLSMGDAASSALNGIQSACAEIPADAIVILAITRSFVLVFVLAAWGDYPVQLALNGNTLPDVHKALSVPSLAPRRIVSSHQLLSVQALARLFGAETLFFRCFYLPPPPLFQSRAIPGDTTLASTHINDSQDASTSIINSPDASTSINGSPDAKAFVLWGLTFGVISDLIVAAGGRTLAFEDPPNFRLVHQGVFLERERGSRGVGVVGINTVQAHSL